MLYRKRKWTREQSVEMYVNSPHIASAHENPVENTEGYTTLVTNHDQATDGINIYDHISEQATVEYKDDDEGVYDRQLPAASGTHL